MTATHNCLDHMRYQECDVIEPHGERFHDEWYQCSVCHEQFSLKELEQMQPQAEEAKRKIDAALPWLAVAPGIVGAALVICHVFHLI